MEKIKLAIEFEEEGSTHKRSIETTTGDDSCWTVACAICEVLCGFSRLDGLVASLVQQLDDQLFDNREPGLPLEVTDWAGSVRRKYEENDKLLRQKYGGST